MFAEAPCYATDPMMTPVSSGNLLPYGAVLVSSMFSEGRRVWGSLSIVWPVTVYNISGTSNASSVITVSLM